MATQYQASFLSIFQGFCVECKPKPMGEPQAGRALMKEASRLTPPATGSPPVKCPGFLMLRTPRALPRSVGGERKATCTLYCSTEKEALGPLGPFVFLSQDESLPLMAETHMMCPRARRAGRNPGEGETVGTPSPSRCLGKSISFPWAWSEKPHRALGHEDHGCGEG